MMPSENVAKPSGGTFSILVLLVVVALITFAIGSGTNGAAFVATCVFFPSVVAIYFFPALVATKFKHPRASAVTLLDLFLGWTLLGWVISLIWAYSMPAEVAAPMSGSSEDGTKTCPFCAEDIRSEAIKCKHCGSALTTPPA